MSIKEEKIKEEYNLTLCQAVHYRKLKRRVCCTQSLQLITSNRLELI